MRDAFLPGFILLILSILFNLRYLACLHRPEQRQSPHLNTFPTENTSPSLAPTL
jgi:hypothetical protein